jgi:hypothetical protein
VNAAHTERTEEQEILFKSSADVTTTEIRRVKRRREMKKGKKEYRLSGILATLPIIKLY